MSRIRADMDPPEAGAEAPAPALQDAWNGLPPPRRWNAIEEDLKNGLLEAPEETIKGLLYRGGKMLISAPSKGRKTWLMLHMAACVSCGKDWLGFSTTRTPVLYLDLELLRHETPRRLRTIAESAGIWDTDNLHVQQLRGHRLGIQRMKRGLIDYCLEHGIGLIVIDPWYKLSCGADEIGTEDVAELLAQIEEVASRANCAVAISHHFTKGDSSQKSVIDLASGSGVFGRDPDLICGLRELKDSTDENPQVKMEFVVRSFKPVAPIGLRWEFPLWVRDQALHLELKGPGSPGRPVENGVEDILEILGERVLSVTDWGDLCCHQLGISMRTFKGLRAKASDEGLIETRKEGLRVLCQRVSAKTPSGIIAHTNPLHERGNRNYVQ